MTKIAVLLTSRDPGRLPEQNLQTYRPSNSARLARRTVSNELPTGTRGALQSDVAASIVLSFARLNKFNPPSGRSTDPATKTIQPQASKNIWKN